MTAISTRAATRARAASSTSCSCSGAISAPFASSRPRTSRTSSRGTSGSGRRESNRIGCGMARRCNSNRSRNPLLVIMPTRAPRRSINALVATVLLWVWCAARHAAASGRSVALISSTPVRMLSPGCAGVLGTLKQCTSPVAVQNTRSVNVPPTSVPMAQRGSAGASADITPSPRTGSHCRSRCGTPAHPGSWPDGPDNPRDISSPLASSPASGARRRPSCCSPECVRSGCTCR